MTSPTLDLPLEGFDTSSTFHRDLEQGDFLGISPWSSLPSRALGGGYGRGFGLGGISRG